MTRLHAMLRPVTLLLALGASGTPALADTIHVGITLSLTGPAASLGIPQRNSVALLPKQVAGQDVVWEVLDDGTDSTRAVANMRKLIDEDGADAVIGSSATPASLAMIAVAAEKAVPMISLAASASLIQPMDARRAWVFKAPQNDGLMADAIAATMAARGVHTVGFIGFNDSYGDGWLAETQRALAARSIRLLDSERYARTDTGVTGQVLKLLALRPDAVLVAAAGTPAALPESTLRERGFHGPIYQTHGAATTDFLRVGGRTVEGTILPAGPVLVAAQLPADNPVRAVALDYVHRYEAAYGTGSVVTFGAHLWDAALLLEHAVPDALMAGKPGTPAFRSALRAAMERTHGLVVSNGVMDMTPQDHNGLDDRARVMVTVQDGAWKLLPQP